MPGKFFWYDVMTTDTVAARNFYCNVAEPYWGYCFNVDGIDAAVERVTAGGGSVSNGPHQVPGGQWIVQCTDPQGAAFALVAMGR